jgi:hypothetical protein
VQAKKPGWREDFFDGVQEKLVIPVSRLGQWRKAGGRHKNEVKNKAKA